MSNKLESLKNKIINTIKGEEDYDKEFIYFWDDVDEIDDNIAHQILDAKSAILGNIIETLQFTAVILVIMGLVFTIIGNTSLLLVTQVVLVFVLIISTYKIQKNYRTSINLLEKSITKFQKMDFSENPELMFYGNLPEIVTNMEDMRKGFVELTKSLNNIAQEMTDSTFSAAQILSTVEQSMISVNDAIEKGGLGTTDYQESKYYVSEITNEVENFTTIFDEAIETNDEVISLLKSLGKQINMLALNAGIEAARAGKKGIGFEVLSTNLQRLSQHAITTTNEMKKIKGQINKKSKVTTENLSSVINLLQIKIDSTYTTVSSITDEIYQTNENVKKLISKLGNLEEIGLLISKELDILKIQ